MKKSFKEHRSFIAIIAAALFIFMGIMGIAQASDVTLDIEVQSVTQATTQNGNPYIRIIVNEKRTLNGVEYNAGTPLMAFGSTVGTVKDLKAGDQIRCIVSERSFQGRKSYTLLKMLE